MKFPKTIFVTIDKDSNSDEEWLMAHDSLDNAAEVGETRRVAEYTRVRETAIAAHVVTEEVGAKKPRGV